MRFLIKHLLLLGSTASVVIFSLAGFLLFQAAYIGVPAAEVGCWEVTDVTGHVSRFTTVPQFDLNVRAIKFEKDGHAGWIFPARVDQDLACSGTP